MKRRITFFFQTAKVYVMASPVAIEILSKSGHVDDVGDLVTETSLQSQQVRKQESNSVSLR